jgi:hypothetical protein
MGCFILKRKIFARILKAQPKKNDNVFHSSTDYDNDDNKVNGFSRNDSRVADTTTRFGKAGLIGTAGLATAGAVEAGRAIHKGVKVGKDLSNLAELRHDAGFRQVVKKNMLNTGDFIDKKIGLPLGVGEKAVGLAKKGEDVFNNIEFSKLDRAQRYWDYLNKGANLNRTVLNNAEHWAELGLNKFTEATGPALTTKEEEAALKNILDKGSHSFATQAEAESFLTKLKDRLSPSEFQKIQRSINGGTAAKFTQEGKQSILNKLQHEVLSPEAKKKLATVPKSVGNAASALLHFKNAKLLAKGAVGLGSLSGVAYFHGKTLQDYRTNAVNSGRHPSPQEQSQQ